MVGRCVAVAKVVQGADTSMRFRGPISRGSDLWSAGTQRGNFALVRGFMVGMSTSVSGTDSSETALSQFENGTLELCSDLVPHVILDCFDQQFR